MTYYGLTLNAGTLVPGADLYITFFVGGVSDFVAFNIALATLFLFGRKVSLCTLFLWAGGALLILLAVPAGDLNLETIYVFLSFTLNN